jgi:hypothetical protein
MANTPILDEAERLRRAALSPAQLNLEEQWRSAGWTPGQIAEEIRRRAGLTPAQLDEEERRRRAGLTPAQIADEDRRRAALSPAQAASDESRRRVGSAVGQANDGESRRRGGFFLFRWFNWLFNNSLATIGVLGLASVGVIALMDPNILTGNPVPVAQAVGTQKWADSSTVYTVNGKDKAGRGATFDVVVLNKDYRWRRGSDTDLMRGNPETLMVGNDLDTYIFRPDVRSGLARASEVIAVGVASQEGDAVPEVSRAGRRAGTGAGWLKIVMGGTGKVSTLNLGQYQGTCKTPDVGDTSWQRPFMMIGARDAQPNINLSEALTDALTGKTNLPSPSCYSHFELARAP